MGRSNVSSSIFAGLSSPNNRNTQTRLPRRNLSLTMTPRAAPCPLASPHPPSHLPRPPTFPFLPHPYPPSPCLPHSHTHAIECRLRFRTLAPCARISRISCLLVRKFGPCWSPTNETATKLVDVEQTNKSNNKCCRRRGRASTRHCEQHRQHEPATNSEARTHMHILAEGAIALSVTLSGGALFAS